MFFAATNANNYPKSFDCPMRQLALEYAQYIQPQLTTTQLQQMVDALDGAIESQNCTTNITNLPLKPPSIKTQQNTWWDSLYDIPTYYIDASKGNDNNIGSILKPFKSIHKALNIITLNNTIKNLWKKIILTKGTHYISNTILLNNSHNNLIITNEKNENVIMSAGILLTNITWKLYKKTKDMYNIYQSNLTDFMLENNLTTINGLRINNIRGLAARYPNIISNEYYPPGFGSNLIPQEYLPRKYAQTDAKPDIMYQPLTPIRNDSVGGYYYYYNLGIGGTACYNFEPNAGYWCSINPQGGGAVTYTQGTGFIFNNTNDSLVNTPYINYPKQAVIHVWRPDHWYVLFYIFLH